MGRNDVFRNSKYPNNDLAVNFVSRFHIERESETQCGINNISMIPIWYIN